jgi:hypothetical protein
MNRIREHNGTFQVLLTPTFNTSPSMELLLGSWSDQNTFLRNFSIVEYPTMRDALDKAYLYPDLDWNKLVSMHYDPFHKINNIIKSFLHQNKYIVELDSVLLTPIKLKNTMFDRVSSLGKSFTPYYNSSDVICINIINPWTHNIQQIANQLAHIPDLNIRNIMSTEYLIRMIGVTDVGTTYEIRLWTTLVAQYARASKNFSNIDENIKTLENILFSQRNIDANYVIR